jgi:phage replication O-like protein O
MANPQIENGYTKIANEIMDALCRFHPGGAEGQVLWSIIRKTYGWNKKADKISIKQLSELTGLSRRTIIYAIQNLEAKNMIIVQRGKTGLLNNVNLLSFQKDYKKWVVQEKDGSARKGKSYKLTIQKQKDNYRAGGSARNSGSARNAQKVVQETVPDIQFLAPTKDTITKNNTKERGAKSHFTPPTATEVENYCKESGHIIDAQRFIDFYTAKGWMIGKNKMKDWKAAVRNWAQREKGEHHAGQGISQGNRPPYRPGGQVIEQDPEIARLLAAREAQKKAAARDTP